MVAGISSFARAMDIPRPSTAVDSKLAKGKQPLLK
jgi:hypothetical protein